MKRERNIHEFTVLSVLTIVLVSCGFSGCDKTTNIVDPSAFKRLLENQIIHSKIFKRDINYAVLLPENYNAVSDSFGVVYLLHGFGDNQSAWYKYGLIQYYSDKYAADNVPMIFVMPQAFNSYYVNRYNGSVRYMDFFTTELVPQIDSLFRTRKTKAQRAVMGYSMGGYGALILPAKHPEIFGVSVPLSMSFRTDEQYMAEPQDVFDLQWGLIFGGLGTSGEQRLTDYFKEYSPFYFFNGGDKSALSELRIFLDCGDDEESLSFTNNALHCIMKDKGIKHEYRVRNGAHSWDYWHSALPEALNFISTSFQENDYPEEPDSTITGNHPPSENIKTLSVSETVINVLLPPGYDNVNGSYPVIYLLRDGDSEYERNEIFSLFYNSMTDSRLNKIIVIDIPAEKSLITVEFMQAVVNQTETEFKTNPSSRFLFGNGTGGGIAASLIENGISGFATCGLFNAVFSPETSAQEGNIFYYLDETDENASYQKYANLYTEIREKGIKYEYRVRQGDDSFKAFLKGLEGSVPTIKKRINETL